jgi:putative tryptophan/tyrosine transport system substrate-binding protein
MRRRDFIKGIAGSATAWPLAARAQQTETVRRIGVLMATPESDPEVQAWKKAFEQRLAELGWTDGRNVRIDYHWAGGDPAFSRTFAKEMLSIGPDVILAVGTASLVALREETHTVPIVFARVSNPVEQGFVASLAKPGANVTGFSNFDPTMSGKWLQTLRDIAPSISRVAMVANPRESDLVHYFRSFTAAASSSIEPIEAAVQNLDELQGAIAKVADKPGGAIIFIPDAFIISNRTAVIAQATKYHLPAIYPFRFFATEGGLASYGISGTEQFHGAATYEDRILKGEKPANLPVQSPSKFELVINLKAAKAIGLTVPRPMLLLADEVIE